MVHKASNKILNSSVENIETTKNRGIHKSKSTSSWLNEYDKEVSKMDKLLDKEYEESELRQMEAEEKINQLQDAEEEERLREEEQLHLEQMRQIELEKAKTEVEIMKKELERAKRPRVREEMVPVVEEKKPSLKQRVVSLGKKVAGVVGALAGHPEVGVVSSVLPEEETKTEIEYKPKEELVLA